MDWRLFICCEHCLWFAHLRLSRRNQTTKKKYEFYQNKLMSTCEPRAASQIAIWIQNNFTKWNLMNRRTWHRTPKAANKKMYSSKLCVGKRVLYALLCHTRRQMRHKRWRALYGTAATTQIRRRKGGRTHSHTARSASSPSCWIKHAIVCVCAIAVRSTVHC